MKIQFYLKHFVLPNKDVIGGSAREVIGLFSYAVAVNWIILLFYITMHIMGLFNSATALYVRDLYMFNNQDICYRFPYLMKIFKNIFMSPP
jgi:hypothetical protein